MTHRAHLLSIAAALGLAGCPGPAPTIPDDIFATPGEIAPYATAAQRATFDRGRTVALRRFSPDDGLGPSFNVSSCTGCHERPTTGGSGAHYRNFLLVRQMLPDGSQSAVGINGIQDQFNTETRRLADAEGANVLALRNPIAFFGVGLLAELNEASILANADPDDLDHDGISGRPNYDRGFVGRFGRKAQTVSIEGFIRGPIFNHMGVTSDPLPDSLKALLPVPSATILGMGAPLVSGVDVILQNQAAAPDMPTVDMDDVPDPELAESDLFDLVSFAMLLAAPLPDEPTEASEAGRALFDQVNCSGCHVPTLEGHRGLIPAYTDLLLHDMGPELADGIRMGLAMGNEYRTQPLWGIAAEGPYLHDGRADTLEDAILQHAGEGQGARDAFSALSDTDRGRVIAFLESLGGLSQRSEGLVPPGTPIAAVGDFGGPEIGLPADGEAQFIRGRGVFDRDMSASVGLGPEFNGDSCRACHFDPVIGGSGPADVDVTRQGILDASGVVMLPSGGTMAHRHDVGAVRPPCDPLSDYFELRQTPALFGLGLVDRITESAILANEDPTDVDLDGISGRAHVLSDGRIGRLGWRADVPSIAEFTRDATTNELGVTVPAETGATFGATTDGDSSADPEMSMTDLQDMRFFLAQLAAPRRHDATDATVVAGEAVFAMVGCGDCHRTMALPDGTPVALYSDLLLHDVAPADYAGVGSGDATGREFRTPPLWGIPSTGPYMHDGLSPTLEEAISRHESEGRTSALAVSALSPADREALLAFLASL